jgi:CRISPR-associated endoribonuclease Cas6
MRIELSLHLEKDLVLPKAYNHILQGFIYTLLDPFLRKFLHKQGYRHGKRQFKLFTFSRLLSRVKSEKDTFRFLPPVKLIISSPKHEIMQNVAEGLLKKQNFVLGKNEVFIESISVLPKHLWNGHIFIKMLSPVTIYSTLRKSDGNKKTYYYSPFENEFNQLIRENLRKKYELVYDRKSDNFDFKISPYRVRPSDEKIIIYKGNVIKAWMGLYKIEGAAEVIELSYDTGLGSKNSQGFGCWEVWKNN